MQQVMVEMDQNELVYLEQEYPKHRIELRSMGLVKTRGTYMFFRPGRVHVEHWRRNSHVCLDEVLQLSRLKISAFPTPRSPARSCDCLGTTMLQQSAF